MKTLGLVAATLAAVALLGLVVAGRMLLSFIGAPYIPGDPRSVVVEVPAGATPAVLAETLRAADLIGRSDWFVFYLEELHRDPTFTPGEYALSPGLSPADIVDRVKKGAVVTYTITVLPGQTTAQVFDAIAKEKLAPRGVLDGLSRDAKLLERLSVPSTSLEGYLGAETYSFSRGMTPEAIVERMVAAYQKGLPPKLLEDARARGLTEAEFVTVASLIERSGLKELEWPEYSAILHNRLKDQIPLEHEAALAFALDKKDLEPADFAADTGFNTFRAPGLPPTPICTPGLAAFAAAAGPKGDGRYMAPRADVKEGHVFCPDEGCVKAAYDRAGVPMPPPRFAKPQKRR